MRGEVIQIIGPNGFGLISGDDGQRYRYRPEGLQTFAPTVGQKVDFTPDGDLATDVYVLAGAGAGPEPSKENLGVWGYFWKCMRLYFNGSGRARRKEYWSFVLFRVVFTILILCAFAFAVFYFHNPAQAQAMTPSRAAADGGPFAIWVVWSIAGLPFAAPGWAVSARRLHDLGMSGWLVLLALIPYLGALFMFICALLPSQAGANQYGRYPKPLWA